MNRLKRLMKTLVSKHRGAWVLDGYTVNVGLGKGIRHQTVRMGREGDDYVLTSVVLGTAAVTKNHRRWAELAILAWQRNAGTQLVTFGFDGQDRLAGQIRHPAQYLDEEELELYVTALARECDRFEYLLTGRDTS